MSETPFAPHRIQLAGHTDLGIVSARRDQSGTWEIEPDATHGRRFVGPASVYVAEEVRQFAPLPESPGIGDRFRVGGKPREILAVIDHRIGKDRDETRLYLFTDGMFLREGQWTRERVKDCNEDDRVRSYSDDDIPF